MSELSRLLDRRRRLDEEGTAVFEGATFREVVPKVNSGKDDASERTAFRSGWSSTPKFQEYGGVKSYAVPVSAETPSTAAQTAMPGTVASLATHLEEPLGTGTCTQRTAEVPTAKTIAKDEFSAFLFAPPDREASGPTHADGEMPGAKPPSDACTHEGSPDAVLSTVAAPCSPPASPNIAEPSPLDSPVLSVPSATAGSHHEQFSSPEISGGFPRATDSPRSSLTGCSSSRLSTTRRSSFVGERSEARKQQRKGRLDKLLSFATAENERLTKLIQDANEDGDKQSDQIQKLLESKKDADRLLGETRRQHKQLEATLKATEAERDAAQKRNKELIAERERLNGLVENTRVENEKLEAIVVDVTREKNRLEEIARQKQVLEKQLLKARAMASDLAEKAKKADQLEEDIKKSEEEQARLRKLLEEGSSASESVRGKCAQLESLKAEAIATNKQLQAELQKRENVEKAMQLMEVENQRLRQKAEASESEQQRLTGVLEQMSTHNHQLQRELQQAQERLKELEQSAEQIRSLQGEKDQLRQSLALAKREMGVSEERIRSMSQEKAALQSRLMGVRRNSGMVTPSVAGSSVAEIFHMGDAFEMEEPADLDHMIGLPAGGPVDIGQCKSRRGQLVAAARAWRQQAADLLPKTALTQAAVAPASLESTAFWQPPSDSAAPVSAGVSDVYREAAFAVSEVSPLEERLEVLAREATSLREVIAQQSPGSAGGGEEQQQRLSALERERAVLQQHLDRASALASTVALEDSVLSAARDEVEVKRQLEAAQASVDAKPPVGGGSAAVASMAVDDLPDLQEQLAAAQARREAAQGDVDRQRSVFQEVVDELLGRNIMESADSRDQLCRQLDEALSRRNPSADDEAAGELAEREALSLQLDEALKRNAELQRKIDEELVPKSAAVQAAEASTNVDFVQMLDGWLSHFGASRGSDPEEGSSGPSWYETFFGSTS